MFERFTKPARAVVTRAHGVARDLGHPHIGAEHLLIALAEPAAGISATALAEHGLGPERLRDAVRAGFAASPSGSGLPGVSQDDAEALRALGIDVDLIKDNVERAFGPDAFEPAGTTRDGSPRWRLPFSSRAKKVLELSLREAIHRSDRHIGSEHILLGLLRDGDGPACRILLDAGVKPAELRRTVLTWAGRAA